MENEELYTILKNFRDGKIGINITKDKILSLFGESKRDIKECSFNDIKFGLIVKDELGRIGKIVANDDIENIKVLLDRNQTEYYSLLVEKLYFV